MTTHATRILILATIAVLIAYAVATWLDHALSFAPIVGAR